MGCLLVVGSVSLKRIMDPVCPFSFRHSHVMIGFGLQCAFAMPCNHRHRRTGPIEHKLKPPKLIQVKSFLLVSVLSQVSVIILES